MDLVLTEAYRNYEIPLYNVADCKVNNIFRRWMLSG